MPHVEGDDGSWVMHGMIPKFCILIVDVFNDQEGVGCDSLQCGFALPDGFLPFVVNDDDGFSWIVVADAEELPLHGGGEFLLFVSVVGEWLEKYVANQFVCPRRLYSKPVSMESAGREVETELPPAMTRERDIPACVVLSCPPSTL